MCSLGLGYDMYSTGREEAYFNRYRPLMSGLFLSFKKPFFIHIYFNHLLYISTVETNYKPLRQFIQEKEIPKLLYRVLRVEDNPPIPKLAYRLIYDRRTKEFPLYICLNRVLFHTKGYLDVLSSGLKFVLKLQFVRANPHDMYLKPYHQVSSYHKSIGYKLYDSILTRMKEEGLTIEEQLRSHPLSTSRLFYIFKQVVGTTPNTVRRDHRLLSFKRELLASPHSISRLFMDSGFKSRSHLYTLFLNTFKMSPSKFRALYGHLDFS